MKRLIYILPLFFLTSYGQVTLEYDGITPVQPGIEFTLPITAGEQMNVGAISLYMAYPPDKLELLNVSSIGGTMMWNIYNYGQVAIGWYGPPFMYMNENDTILTLTLKSNYFGQSYFTLDDDCEFGTPQFMPFPATIRMHMVDCITGIMERELQDKAKTIDILGRNNIIYNNRLNYSVKNKKLYIKLP